MTIATTEAGMQVYTGNFLNGTVEGKGGQRLAKYQAITFEAQGFPESPNQPAFPSARLDPGQTYTQTTVHHFYRLAPQAAPSPGSNRIPYTDKRIP